MRISVGEDHANARFFEYVGRYTTDEGIATANVSIFPLESILLDIQHTDVPAPDSTRELRPDLKIHWLTTVSQTDAARVERDPIPVQSTE